MKRGVTPTAAHHLVGHPQVSDVVLLPLASPLGLMVSLLFWERASREGTSLDPARAVASKRGSESVRNILPGRWGRGACRTTPKRVTRRRKSVQRKTAEGFALLRRKMPLEIKEAVASRPFCTGVQREECPLVRLKAAGGFGRVAAFPSGASRRRGSRGLPERTANDMGNRR